MDLLSSYFYNFAFLLILKGNNRLFCINLPSLFQMSPNFTLLCLKQTLTNHSSSHLKHKKLQKKNGFIFPHSPDMHCKITHLGYLFSS